MARRVLLHMSQPHWNRLPTDNRRNLQHYRSGSRSVLRRGPFRTHDLLEGNQVHRGPIHIGEVGTAAELHCDLLGLVYQCCLILPADKTNHAGEYVCRFLRAQFFSPGSRTADLWLS